MFNIKRFEEFVKDEFTFLYEDEEIAEMMFDRTRLSNEQIELVREQFDEIVSEAIEGMIEDDWFWQNFHDIMDEHLEEAIKDFVVKEEF